MCGGGFGLGAQAAGLAVGAVRANQDRGLQRLGRAVGERNLEFDVSGQLAEGDNALDFAELGTPTLPRGGEGLLETEGIEA